jgi:hypothetical protein
MKLTGGVLPHESTPLLGDRPVGGGRRTLTWKDASGLSRSAAGSPSVLPWLRSTERSRAEPRVNDRHHARQPLRADVMPPTPSPRVVFNREVNNRECLTVLLGKQGPESVT